MDCSQLRSSVHGIYQARVLEWVAISFSRGSAWPRDWTRVSCIVGRTLYSLSHQESPTEHPSEQNPDSPISQSPIRMLPQASYPYPSEGRQNENHSHRKLTKLITWITVLSNSVKLWAMPCRAIQDQQVIVESSDKTWSTTTDSKLGNKYIKAVYCHPAYLTYMQVHHEKCQAGWSTNWSQNCRENDQ